MQTIGARLIMKSSLMKIICKNIYFFTFLAFFFALAGNIIEYRITERISYSGILF